MPADRKIEDQAAGVQAHQVALKEMPAPVAAHVDERVERLLALDSDENGLLDRKEIGATLVEKADKDADGTGWKLLTLAQADWPRDKIEPVLTQVSY